MSEIKTHYNINTLDAREINFVLNQIANRLDALEGLRGTPKFYANINANAHKIQNLEQATETNEALAFPLTISDFTDSNHNHEDAAGGGKLDHGEALTGLEEDDDHTQYLLLAGRNTQVIDDVIKIGNIDSGNYIEIGQIYICVYADNNLVHKIGETL